MNFGSRAGMACESHASAPWRGSHQSPGLALCSAWESLLIRSRYDVNGQARLEGAANATNASRKAKAVSRPYSHLSDGGRHSGGHHRELEQLGERTSRTRN